MKTQLRVLVIVMAAATAAAAGCAHSGSEVVSSEARGATQLRREARLLVTGPASSVHATAEGTRSVTLFIAAAVNGDDGDCGRAIATHSAINIGSSRQVQVPSGRALCAISNARSSGSNGIELLWHAHLNTSGDQVAWRSAFERVVKR